MKLLSDQITEAEVGIILRELNHAIRKLGAKDFYVVEFGCYVGTAAVHVMAALQGAGVAPVNYHVYDSFSGLPPKLAQDDSPAGLQFVTGELLATKAQLVKNFKQSSQPLPVIHKGWFEELAPKDVPDGIGFAFLDGDYYQSIKSSLKLLKGKLKPGATIVVDDYANEALPGARRAVDEWVLVNPCKVRSEASLAILTVT